MKRIKKTTLAILSLICFASHTFAAEISVANVTIDHGGTAWMEVYLTNTDVECTGFQFLLNLPQGITPAKDATNAYILQKGSRVSTLALTTGLSDKGNHQYQVMGYQGSGLPVAFPGTEGQVLTILLQADNTVAEGDVLDASLTDIRISDTSAASHGLSNASFSITVTAPTYTILDENSTTVPESSNGETVNIRVLRTIKANEWSTICLPFAMTEAETKRVFGDDVKLYSFVDYECLFDDVTDAFTGISVHFEEADLAVWGFEANFPYLIKVTAPISAFETNAIITPDEANAIVEYATGSGSRRHVYGTFYGTLRAGTKVPADCLFIGNDKFYYSTGKTNIKAFRGYFDFEDKLSDYVDNGIKIRLDDRGEPTGIEISTKDEVKSTIYDVSGRRVSIPTRGLYIIDGKKVFKNQ
ncbi:MAG: hypothetical protein Q4E32_02505 [Bacteroidales bacterium]|nr:hypothetical protein [Bacteroidales bacterium]